MISRRQTLGLFGAVAATALLPGIKGARAAATEFRIGWQKNGVLALAKRRGALEKRLADRGIAVSWSEFTSGPPLLEALGAGALDLGATGDVPPLFAQAAGGHLYYVGLYRGSPAGSAILVRKDSPIKSLEDLKGKKVAFNKGSNVHYLLVKALEEAGLTYADVEPSFLAPADGRAAFEKGAVDAWVIWDPFQAAAEIAIEARELRNGEGIVPNHQFYLGTKTLVDGHSAAIDVVIEAISEIDDWTKSGVAAAAAELSPSVGIPEPVLVRALERQSYGVKSLDASVVAQQQAIADTFYELKLIPKKVTIADAVRGGKA